MVLQLCYAIATFAALKDWAIRPPPTLPAAPGLPHPPGRRLANWLALREALLKFVSPRVATHDDIPTVPIEEALRGGKRQGGKSGGAGTGAGTGAGSSSSSSSGGGSGGNKDGSKNGGRDGGRSGGEDGGKDGSFGVGERSLPDLGPSLVDGKVLLALLHSADPFNCPCVLVKMLLLVVGWGEEGGGTWGYEREGVAHWRKRSL